MCLLSNRLQKTAPFNVPVFPGAGRFISLPKTRFLSPWGADGGAWLDTQAEHFGANGQHSKGYHRIPVRAIGRANRTRSRTNADVGC